mgnify:CR=1 FL=1
MEKELLQLGDVILRALISLITLFLITKLLGKKQVSQLSLFDYVIGISIGNFAAEMTINLESEYLHGTVAVIVFGLVAYGVSILTMKSIWLRRFFMGRPTILIQDGEMLLEGLKQVKFDVNDGFHGVTITGDDVVQQYLPDFSTPGASKKGEVEMVACVALKNANNAGVLRNIKIA